MSPKRWLLSILDKPEILLGVAACLSLALILIPKDLMSYSHELNPTQYKAELLNDAYSGGNSLAQWINADTQRWSCSIGQAFKNPYCSLHIRIANSEVDGLDLSRFTKMTIWMAYKGNGKHLRFYLRNRGENYYMPSDQLSTKYNVVEVPTDKLEEGLEIEMADFAVAGWWLVQRNIPLQDSKPEFNDVSSIEIQTGSAVTSGVHEIQLKRIVWQGPIVSELALYRGITIVWTVLIIALLLSRLARLRYELNRQKSYQQDLVAINNILSLQNRQFEDLARTDPLTGLLNRIGIRDVLYDGLMRWKKHHTHFSLILIDLDHFKKINDTYGHDVGDEILKNAADAFKNSVRKSDFLARWGGEEFILLCHDTNLVQAMSAAESLRKRLESTPVYRDIRVTASFGVATLSQPDLDHLFKCADEALYRAKNRGRNCVMSDVRLSA